MYTALPGLTLHIYKCRHTQNNSCWLLLNTVVYIHLQPSNMLNLHLHLEEGLQCFGNGGLFQLLKSLDAALDEGTHFIAVVQLLFPGGIQKQQAVHKKF